jgi:hypothetical protein
MDLASLAKNLIEIEGDYVYLYCPSMDFTSKIAPKLGIFAKNKNFEVPLEKPFIERVLKLLTTTIFSSEKMVVSWNIKELFSFALYRTGKPLNISSDPLAYTLDRQPISKEPVIIDLGIIESYLGLLQSPPKSYQEAVDRVKIIHPHFNSVQAIYNNIHQPLVKEIIPQLETEGIIFKKNKLYAHYEIEGQENGRLRCDKIFSKSYNPHVIRPDEKPHYKTPMLGGLFIYFDYQAWEVYVLQWLSGDKRLGRILDSGRDVYVSIFEELTGKTASNAREFGKKLFLPTVYGMGSKTLAEKINVKQETAAALIDRLHKIFPQVFSYTQSMQESLKEGFVTDVFNRRRVLDEDKAYLARNFSVQSPAATITLFKLIKLCRALNDKNYKIGFYVHDGYVIFSDSRDYKQIIRLAQEVLESECEIASGLKLKVACQAGYSLDKMKEIRSS